MSHSFACKNQDFDRPIGVKNGGPTLEQNEHQI